jgi:hypothetical protein
VGIVDRRTSIDLSLTLSEKRPSCGKRFSAVLRQALLCDVEATHELEARDQRAGDAAAVDLLLLQHAVDTLAHPQRAFAGLDVNVRGAHLHRVLEHRLNESDDRRVGRAFVRTQLFEVDVAFAELFAHFLCDRGDFVRATINDVDGLEQVAFLDERDAQRLLQAIRKLVVCDEVGRIGHADEQAACVGLQHERAEPARLRFGQHAHDFMVERELANVDERNLQALRQNLIELLFANQLEVGQYAA